MRQDNLFCFNLKCFNSKTIPGARAFRSQSDRVQRLLPDRQHERDEEDFGATQRNVTYLRPKQIQVFTFSVFS